MQYVDIKVPFSELNDSLIDLALEVSYQKLLTKLITQRLHKFFEESSKALCNFERRFKETVFLS